jgi:membrane protein YqaA with SNARE-associated domain
MSVFVRQPIRLPAPLLQKPLAPHWLTHLGALGLFSVAVVDSSVIPLPLPGSTDVLLLWLVAHSGDPWLLAPCAIAGSILGGYTTWHIGRRGGEEALRQYVPARLLGPIAGWVERHRILAVFLPALLPPPIPLLPFALASGALAFRAADSSPSSARLAPCATPSLHGLVLSTGAGSSVYGLEPSRRSRLRCFASSWAYW